MADNFGLTPAELDEVQQQVFADPAFQQRSAPASAAPANPFSSLSAQEIADLSVQTNGDFDPVTKFMQTPDLDADAETVQKVADARKILDDRGFFEKLGDINPRKAIVGTLESIYKGGKRLVEENPSIKFGPLAPAAALFNLGKDVAQKGLKPAIQERERGMIEQAAATESGVFGFLEGATEIAGKVGRTALGPLGLLEEDTPESRRRALWDDVGRKNTQEAITKGQGGLVGSISGSTQAELNAAGLPVRPEVVQDLTAVDAPSFMLWGRALKPFMAAIPSVGRGIAQAAGPKVAEAAGKALAGVGAVAEATGKGVQAVAPAAKIVAPVVGGLTHGFPGAAGGVLVGKQVAKGIAEAGERVEILGSAAKVAGQEAAQTGATVARGAAGQLVHDVATGLPGAAAAVGSGAAFDVALALMTTDNPQEMANASAFGTLFGLGGAGAAVSRRVISGQLVSPREYGSQKIVPLSGIFPALDRMMTASAPTLKPGEQLRLNAMRELATRVGAEVYHGTEAEMTKALTEMGVDPSGAQQGGFFTTEFKDASGKPRRVALVTEIGAAPHESRHAIENVIGEVGMREVDKLVAQEYSAEWDQLGQQYVRALIAPKIASGKLTPAQAQAAVTNWRKTLSEASGMTNAEALEKLIRDTEAADGKPLDDASRQRIAEEWDNIRQRGGSWRDIVADPAQQAEMEQVLGNRYLAREIAAEHFDAALKNMGTQLKRTDLAGKLAWMVANTMRQFGVDPVAGRASERRGVPLNFDVLEKVAEQGHEFAPEPVVKPKAAAPAPTPAGPRAPVTATPQAQADAAKEARDIADAAPEVPEARGMRSPRELLGQIAEAIATRLGLKVDYRSAPGEPAAAITSNRTARREIIEAFRTMPEEARALWEKQFVPERVTVTKGGKYQIQGWAPEVLAANMQKLAAALTKAGKQPLLPWEMDANGLTAKGWTDFHADLMMDVANQGAGRTGAGGELVVPPSAVEAGAFKPAEGRAAGQLDQRKADFINALFHFPVPATPRITGEVVPRNVVMQDVSEATLPGRTSGLVQPKVFAGEKAARLGVEGREVKEVNPARVELKDALGADMPSFIEVIQKINLEHIADVTTAPEIQPVRGNTLTLGAGFSPKTFTISGTQRGEKIRKEFKAEDMAGARRMAENEAIRVANVAPVREGEMVGGEASFGRQYSPKTAAEYRELANDQTKFTEEMKAYPGGLTKAAYDLGARTSTVESLAELKQSQHEMKQKFSEAMKSGNMDEAMQLATTAQFFREAGEAATGTGSAGQFLRKQDASYKPPLEGVQFSPRTESGKLLEKDGYEFKHAGGPFNRSITVEKAGVPIGEITSTRLPKEAFMGDRMMLDTPGRMALEAEGREPAFDKAANLDFVVVNDGFRGKGIGEALYRELLSQLQADGATHLTGMVVRPEPIALREKASPGASEYFVDGEPVPLKEALAAADSYSKSGRTADGSWDIKAIESFTRIEEGRQYSPADLSAFTEEAIAARQAARRKAKPYKFTAGLAKAKTVQLPVKEDLDGSAGGELRLLHFSGADPVKLDPKAMGKGAATPRDMTGIPKTFFFVEGSKIGGDKNILGEKPLYGVRVDGGGIYDFKSDTLNLSGERNNETQEQAIKDAGYTGFKVTAEDGREVVALFYPTTPTGVTRAGRETRVNAPPGAQFSPKAFSDPTFEKEIDKIKSGESFGQTFNGDGTVWTPENKKQDLVSLASVNIPRGEVSQETVSGALRSFSELLDEPNVVAGMFAFEKDGKPMVSVDLNAVIPDKYRANTKAFAKSNDQVSIWDVSKGEEIKTGGKGDTKLTKLQEVLDALDLLSEGKPVNVDEIVSEYSRTGVSEQKALSGFEGVREFEGAKIAQMSRSELMDYFPEAVVPRRVGKADAEGNVSRKEPMLTSDITESPLYKKAGGEEKAVEEFADKFVRYLEPFKDLKAFKDGASWYSGFVPRLKKAFGDFSQQFAELLAASSPQTNPQVNFGYAHDAVRSWQDGRFDKIISKFNEGLEKVADGSWEPWLEKQVKSGKASKETAAVQNRSAQTFLAEWVTLHDLKPKQTNGRLYGQHSEALLQVFARKWLENTAGPKTQNFVQNLMGTGHGATIDLWADRTLRRLGYEGSVPRWRILPKNQAGVRDVDFAFAQKVFQATAEKMGLKADDIQGAAWFVEKVNWAREGWGRLDLGDYRKELDKLPMLEQGYRARASALAKEKKAKGKPVQQQQDLFGLVQPRK